MTPENSQKDPRQIITSTAFTIPDRLLGLNLASPKRRLTALIIDLIIAGSLSMISGYLLVVFLALLMMILPFRKTAKRRFRSSIRWVLVTAGVFTLFITLVTWYGLVFINNTVQPILSGKFDNKEDSLKYVQVMQQIGQTIHRDTAAARQLEAAMNMPELKTVPGNVTQVLHQIMKQTGIMTDSISSEKIMIIQNFAKAYSLRDSAQIARLQPETEQIVAGNTIRLLNERIDAQLMTMDTLTERNETLEQQIANPSFKYLATALLNDLGLAVGWMSFYFIFCLFWWDGRTIGKALLRIKVVRLNGNPVLLWHSFERYGGYAAGIATGMLGFLQIFWDANRQCIHDKIAGTVVIKE